MIRRVPIILIFLTLSGGSALADSEAACDASCSDGKVVVSYADGNSVTCMCVEPSAMEPTVADPDVPTGEDPDNTH